MADSWFGINIRNGSARIETSTVVGGDVGVLGDHFEAVRVEVRGQTDDGFKIGSHVTLRESCGATNRPRDRDLMRTACKIQSGVQSTVISSNWLDGGGPGMNSALFIAPDLGPDSPGPLIVDRNVFGGGNYSLYCIDGNNGSI